jgi:MATE family multidrug resistance protein
MSSIRREALSLTRLSAPVIATQMGNMLLGVVDMVMVGHVSVEALAAAGLGHTWIFAVLLFGMGIVLGMDPLVSQTHGAGDGRGTGLALQRGIVVALVASVPMGLLWAATGPVLLLAGQDPTLAHKAQGYTLVQLPSIPFFMVSTALRHYLQGRALVTPAMWVMLIANIFNLFFNWVLIFGNLGFPALGLLGAGIATGLTRVVVLLALLSWIFGFKLHRGAWIPWGRAAFKAAGLRQILVYGLPVGLQLFLEVWAFSMATLMAGRLGASALAAHNIVMNLASLSFMVPLGISFGVSTRVGNLIGGGNQQDVMRACGVAFIMGGGVMTLSAVVFVLGRHWLPTLYIPDPSVTRLCAWILPIAASFQLFDGIQVVGSGILRGMGRTRTAAGANAFGYYLLALPLGGLLAFHSDLGLAGIWWGLCLGLASVAILLVLWVWRKGPQIQPTRITG